MITAFQRTAFQDNAYQIGVAVGAGGRRLPYAWSFKQAEREEEERKKREEEEAALAAVIAPELEVVTAQAAPIVVDLPPQVMLMAKPAPRDDLHDFLQLMIKLAQVEDEIA